MRLHGLHGYTAQLLCMRLHLVLDTVCVVHTAQLLGILVLSAQFYDPPPPHLMPHHQLTLSNLSLVTR
jgi:hypothetical protein